MKNSKMLKNVKEVKELMEFSKGRENKTEILIWGILVTIGYTLTHFLQFSFPIGIPFAWLVLVSVGIASSIILGRRDKARFGESFSFIQSRIKYLWFCAVAIGFTTTYFSVGLGMFQPEFIPVFWFLIIGLATFIEGLFTTKGWLYLGLIFILSGISLVLVSGLLPYWALLFAVVHGGGFIIIGLTKNERNR